MVEKNRTQYEHILEVNMKYEETWLIYMPLDYTLDIDELECLYIYKIK